MIRRLSGIATGVLALLALVGLERCTCNCVQVDLTLRTVVVDLLGKAYPDDTTLKMSHGDTVAWVPSEPSHTLTITFDASKYPGDAKGEPPFAFNAVNGQNQVFSANNSTIYSGAINPKLKAVLDAHSDPNYQLIYPYDQTLAGVTKDGRIIIMK